MRHKTPRALATAACAGLLAVSLAGCGDDSSDASTTSSSSTSESTSEDTDKHAYAEAEAAIKAKDQHDMNKPVPADAEWADDTYRKAVKDALAEDRKMKVTRKGEVTNDSVHPETSDPDAPGGWDLSVISCSTSTVRIYDDKGKDVTGDPDTGEDLPKKPQKGVHRVSFTTPDDGETWQIHQIQQLDEKEAKESPCDVS